MAANELKETTMIIDPADLDPTSSYKLLIGSVLPRAIAWVSTSSAAGVGNIAPISFFTVVGRFPPVLSITLQPRADGETLKDTFVNIRDTNEFVVNIATIGQADAVHRSAYEFGTDVDEFEALGLAKAASETISAPRIAGAPISFECVVDRIIPMPPLPDHVVWGRVKRIHIRDDLYLPNGRIDIGALGVFGRLAGEYTLVDNIFSTPLPDELVDSLGSQRAARLDERATDYSPIDTTDWSPSGSTLTVAK
jgi:flavin reductase (DIM6/NTAB) family NADH-FMN oxidoreductase RutF